MSQQVHDELSRCIVQLLLKEPFFGHLLGSVTRLVGNETATAAVGVRGHRPMLIVNPDFFTKVLRKGPERIGVVKHEALHLLFKHLFRTGRHRKDPLIFNLAADLVVNQFIKGPWKLPDGAITLDTFPDIGLKPDQTLEWYYERLNQCERSQVCTKAGAAIANARSGGWTSGHEHWGDLEDDLEDIADAEIDRLVVQARDRAGPRGWGALPAAIRDLVSAAIERRQPKLNWQRALRLFAASSRRTRILSTSYRPSKRYGTFPGTKVKQFQNLAVVIDTSGSISDGDLTAFFGEIHGMWRAGASITVIECDATVQNTWEYRGRLPKAVGGRGSTSFDPPFRWLREHRGRGTVDGCIYLTDGVAPEPTVRPPCRLMWVVLPGGSMGPHLKWGRAVQIS